MSSTAAAIAAAVARNGVRGGKPFNFFDVARRTPTWGVGERVQRKLWARYDEPCFATVVRGAAAPAARRR